MIETMKSAAVTMGRALQCEVQNREKTGDVAGLDRLVTAAFHLAQFRAALDELETRGACHDLHR